MLYGEKVLDKTIVISTRCGMDPDCNHSSAAGVLFTSIGAFKLPARYKEKLDEKKVFSHTSYNFTQMLDVCEKLAREYVVREGGYIEKDKNNKEVFVIPVKKAEPDKLVFSWDPEPIANSLFTEEEMSQQKYLGFLSVQAAVTNIFPGWTVSNCGRDMNPGFVEDYKGRKNVIMTHPLDKTTPCVFSRDIDVQKAKNHVLKVVVSHHNKGDWELVIRVNGSEQKRVTVGKNTVGEDGWLEVEYSLNSFAGNKITVDLENKANGWMNEAAYWSEIKVEN